MVKNAKRTRSKKKQPRKKAAPKRAVKKNHKKAKPEKVAKSKRGFMWKLLENKEKQLKEQAQKPHANPEQRGEQGFRSHPREPAFSKFSGPRRRAG